MSNVLAESSTILIQHVKKTLFGETCYENDLSMMGMIDMTCNIPKLVIPSFCGVGKH